MPRYFFHVSGAASFEDREGQELTDDQAAWSVAVASTGELLRDLDGSMPDHAELKIVVSDHAGATVASLRFFAERRVKPSHPASSPAR